jgi:hypothetical protein
MALTGPHFPGAAPLSEEDVRGLQIESVTPQGQLNSATWTPPADRESISMQIITIRDKMAFPGCKLGAGSGYREPALGRSSNY